MRVGLTYDLRKDYLDMGYSEEETAEFDSEDTVEQLSRAIENLGYEVYKVGNILNLVNRLAMGERWDLVFNVAEGLHGRSREAQVPALLEAYAIPYTFSDPLTLALSLDKAMAKRVVRDAGVPTPWFHLVEARGDIAKIPPPPSWPLFVKPVSEGTGKGVDERSIVRGKRELQERCRLLLQRYRQPVLVETFLPGREFTVGILGTGTEARPVGVIEVKLLAEAEREVYSYTNKERCESLVQYVLVEDPAIAAEASSVSIAAYSALGCRDGGRIDVRANAAGRLEFIEANPLAGLNPTHSDLPILCSLAGMSYQSLIGGIVESASRRIVARTLGMRSPRR
jgi:D-alanine-D-alanine ligase